MFVFTEVVNMEVLSIPQILSSKDFLVHNHVNMNIDNEHKFITSA